MKQISAKIESLNETSCILKAVDGRNIPKTALDVELASYYCGRGFIRDYYKV
jgi:hypothetical protein